MRSSTTPGLNIVDHRMSPTRAAHTSPPLESPLLLVRTLGQLEDFGRKLQDGPGGREAATSVSAHFIVRIDCATNPSALSKYIRVIVCNNLDEVILAILLMFCVLTGTLGGVNFRCLGLGHPPCPLR